MKPAHSTQKATPENIISHDTAEQPEYIYMRTSSTDDGCCCCSDFDGDRDE